MEAGGGQWGLRWMGREGSLCLGLVTLEHLTLPPRPPTQDGQPGMGWEWGWGAGVGGTRCPQLSVFGAAQRKSLSRWEVPYAAAGGPEVLAPPSIRTPTSSRIAVLLGALLQCTSPAVPTLGGDKSANRSPPLG